MAIETLVHMNECGLPLNAIEWLEKHHRSKARERKQMIRNLHLAKGCFVVDAGCGPGLWTPLLAQAIGRRGRILGVDISTEALVTARERGHSRWYERQVQYKLATLEQLPIQTGKADIIFSANVSQYLSDPVATFAAMGPYLRRGGRLVIKDIDFGTLRFYNIDPGLQACVFQARERWERARINQGYAFEDSWVGSKLAGYLRAAGFADVQEKSYRIVRRSPLSTDYQFYLQGIAEWFICEGAPYLDDKDMTKWLQCFLDEHHSVFNQETFMSEETEFVVTGVWRNASVNSKLYFDMHVSAVEDIALVASG